MDRPRSQTAGGPMSILDPWWCDVHNRNAAICDEEVKPDDATLQVRCAAANGDRPASAVLDFIDGMSSDRHFVRLLRKTVHEITGRLRRSLRLNEERQAKILELIDQLRVLAEWKERAERLEKEVHALFTQAGQMKQQRDNAWKRLEEIGAIVRAERHEAEGLGDPLSRWSAAQRENIRAAMHAEDCTLRSQPGGVCSCWIGLRRSTEPAISARVGRTGSLDMESLRGGGKCEVGVYGCAVAGHHHHFSDGFKWGAARHIPSACTQCTDVLAVRERERRQSAPQADGCDCSEAE